MAYFKDGRGQLWEFDDPEEGVRQGLTPATPEDIRAHNHALDVAEAGQGTTIQAGVEAAERVVGGAAEGIQRATGLGTAPGLAELPGGGLGALQEAYSPEASLRREAHPLAAGIGTGLAATPLSGLAAAGGAALLPAAAPIVGGAIGGIAAESAIQAVAQEYDDAWLEQRPMQLQQVAAKTLLFAGGDLLFRGAFQAGKRLLFGLEQGLPGLGARNLVSEAQGAARELAPEFSPAGGGGSVGAARAADLDEPFDAAIRSMSDKDAAVLARDAEDHLHLVSQHASESFTRVNQGLTDSLGSRLKYEDFAANAQSWDAPLLERQAKWLDGMVEQGDDVAREIAAFAEGNKASVDFGNLGRKAVKLIDGFNTRLAQETDPARRNWMVDNLKKEFDGLTMSIDASFGVDDVTRSDLKGLIAPYREALRKGLENPKYWGENAELQRSLNAPWHTFLKDWPAVQRQVLEATGNVQFDQMGAGRIGRESTVDRMLSLLGKDPRSNQEFGRHLAGALDGLQGLIEARQARGIAGTEGLEAMAADVRNLMEDWNLAQTIGVAKNRVDIMKRDPRKWGTLALSIGERLPIVGQPIQIGRNLGEALTDLHIQGDTPLAAVWDRAYQRYAQNPALQDPAIARSYADWVIDALRGRGGAVPPPGAAGAPAAPMANDVMTGAPGFRQAAQPAAEGSIFGGSQRPAPSAGAQRIRKILERRRTQEGALYVELPKDGPDLIQEPLFDFPGQPRLSLIPAARFVQSEAQQQGLKPWQAGNVARKLLGDDAGEIVDRALTAAEARGVNLDSPGAASELADAMDAQFMRKAWQSPLKRHAEAAASSKAAASAAAKAPAEIVGEFDDIAEGLQKPPDMKEALASMRESISPEGRAFFKRYQSGVGFLMNRDLREGVDSRYTEWAQDVSGYLQQAIEDGATAPGLVVRGLKLPAEEVEKLRGSKVLTARAFVSTSPSAKIAKRFATASQQAEVGSMRRVAGEQPVLFEVEQATGVALSAGEVTLRPGTQFKMLSYTERNLGTKTKPQMVPVFRVREIGYNPRAPSDAIIAGGIIGLGGAGAAAAYAPPAQAAESPPPDAVPPAHAYRDALREIDKAGDRQLQALASEALRRRPSKGRGKGPLELFAGKGGLQEAVESSRERLGAVGADPAALVKDIAGSVGELARTHPSVYAALVQKAFRIAAYLQRSAPQPTATTLLEPRGAKLSFDRAWDYAARFVGATQPRVALREVVRGTAPPEMIEALRETWGDEIWEPFKASFVGQLQRMHAGGRHIPSERLRRWDTLLGMNGQLDPSASLAVAQHLLAAQDAEQQRREQAGQKRGAGALSNTAGASMRTRLDAINSERQMQ